MQSFRKLFFQIHFQEETEQRKSREIKKGSVGGSRSRVTALENKLEEAEGENGGNQEKTPEKQQETSMGFIWNLILLPVVSEVSPESPETRKGLNLVL